MSGFALPTYQLPPLLLTPSSSPASYVDCVLCTPQIVKVKDRYLGLLRLALMLAIALYIVVKVIILDKVYNKHEVPVGSVRTTLKMPSKVITYADYPYCNQGTNAAWKAVFNEDFKCQVWDDAAVKFPTEEVNAAFVTTRVLMEPQVYVCGQDDGETGCATPYALDSDADPPENVFLAGVEEYTMGLSHQYQATTVDYSNPASHDFAGSSAVIQGELVDIDGKVVKTFKVPQGLGAKPTPDIIAISEFIQAAHANLATKTVDDVDGHSQYYNGAVFMVHVEYSNASGEVKYKYRVQQIPGASYKVTEVRNHPMDPKGDRLVVNRAGLKFIFVVSGDLVAFDFPTLLLHLNSALGMMTIATVLVDMLMLHLMPMRAYYTKAKFEETADFSDIRDKQVEDTRAQLDQLNIELAELRARAGTQNTDENNGEVAPSLAPKVYEPRPPAPAPATSPAPLPPRPPGQPRMS